MRKLKVIKVLEIFYYKENKKKLRSLNKNMLDVIHTAATILLEIYM